MKIINAYFGELVIETDVIEVTSNLPRPDKNWSYIDQQGHGHHWDEGYPTLARVEDHRYTDDDGELIIESHLECPQCHETIAPGMSQPMGREFIPGRTSYLLNGQPIDERQATELLARARAET